MLDVLQYACAARRIAALNPSQNSSLKIKYASSGGHSKRHDADRVGGGMIAPQDEFKLAVSCWLLAFGRQRKSKSLIEVCEAGRESLFRKGVGGQAIDY